MVSSTPRPHFTPGKEPVLILQESGWAPGPVWKGGKSRPHRDSISDRPARSSVSIPTELPGPQGNRDGHGKCVAEEKEKTGNRKYKGEAEERDRREEQKRQKSTEKKKEKVFGI